MTTTFEDQPDYVRSGVALIREALHAERWLNELSDLRVADLWRDFSQDFYSAGWMGIQDPNDIAYRHFSHWLKSNDDVSLLTRSETT